MLRSVSSTARNLDAGDFLSVRGPRGDVPMPRKTTATSSSYSATLGGNLSGAPPFLDPGTYSVSGGGGPDIGVFSASVTSTAAITWTNQDQVLNVDRAKNLTMTWSGADASTPVMAVVGANFDGVTNAAVMFMCLAPSTSNSFTIPAPILSSMPASQPTLQSTGLLLLGALPTASTAKFAAPGLDAGFLVYLALTGKTVLFQ